MIPFPFISLNFSFIQDVAVYFNISDNQTNDPFKHGFNCLIASYKEYIFFLYILVISIKLNEPPAPQEERDVDG